MHLDVLLVAAVAVLAPVGALIAVRRRRPEGAPGTAPDPDKTVLHCAAPAPQARSPRT